VTDVAFFKPGSYQFTQNFSQAPYKDTLKVVVSDIFIIIPFIYPKSISQNQVKRGSEIMYVLE